MVHRNAVVVAGKDGDVRGGALRTGDVLRVLDVGGLEVQELEGQRESDGVEASTRGYNVHRPTAVDGVEADVRADAKDRVGESNPEAARSNGNAAEQDDDVLLAGHLIPDEVLLRAGRIRAIAGAGPRPSVRLVQAEHGSDIAGIVNIPAAGAAGVIAG